MLESVTAQLRELARGPTVVRGDAGYHQARAVYNAMHDKRPLAVTRCTDPADVRAVVRFAAEHDLPLAVRGGGHSVPGFGTCDDGIVLDLSDMAWVRVDTETGTARVGGGTTWGALDHATHAFGRATTGGVISTTGVAGLTLGGGIGYLTRSHGLSCDNLLSVDIVTAQGEFVTASDYQHADLFWALRGGGGNFGVVTSMELQLHPVDEVVAGPIFYELEHAPEVLRFFDELMAVAPPELGAFFAFQIAPPLSFIPEHRHGEAMVAVVSCWTGPPSEADRYLRPLRDVAPVVAEHVGAMPYPALNSAFDGLLPPGLRHYWKADFLAGLSDAAVDAYVEHGRRVPCVQSTVHLYPVDGAVHRVTPEETAFPWRDMRFASVIAGMWPDAADDEANIGWVQETWAAVAPHGSGGGYVNFMAADDESRVRANYRGNYDRLAEVKATYDPGNLFRLNQNIEPRK